MKRLITTIIIIGAMLIPGCIPAAAPAEPAEPESPAAMVIEPETPPATEPAAPSEPEVTGPEPAPETEPEVTGPEPEPEPPEEDTGVPEVGQKAPDFKMMQADGTTSYLSEFDQPVVLNFWNTGCRFCVVEMPLLEEVYNEKREEGLILLTVNIAESLETVSEFLDDHQISIPVLLDTSASITQRYLVQYLPTTFFIDADGIIQDKAVGAFRNKADIQKHLDKIMP